MILTGAEEDTFPWSHRNNEEQEMDQEVAESEPVPAVPVVAAKPSIARSCLLREGILVGSRDKKALAEFRALV